jgi:methionyl aminopeptidase
MIIAKSTKEIGKMRAAGQLVGQVLQDLRRMVAPGVTTMDLDRAAETMIRDGGALPTFKGYHGFPYSICASVNEQVVHGFPSPYELREGDIFSIDVGVTLAGYVGDTATTVPVGRVSEDCLKLVRVTEECLERAIEQCRAGNHIGDIGWAVQQHAEAHGYSVVREYVGHGIGRQMHEDPQIPNYGRPGHGPKIKIGYVFAVEPMVNMGTHQTKVGQALTGSTRLR